MKQQVRSILLASMLLVGFVAGGSAMSVAAQTDQPTDAEASVNFEDQSVEDGTVTVSSATLPDGGFVAIHVEKGEVIGVSDYLEPGAHEDIAVQLDEDPDSEIGVAAALHEDTNDNQAFDYAGMNSAEDTTYFEIQRPVNDDAVLRPTADAQSGQTAENQSATISPDSGSQADGESDDQPAESNDQPAESNDQPAESNDQPAESNDATNETADSDDQSESDDATDEQPAESDDQSESDDATDETTESGDQSESDDATDETTESGDQTAGEDTEESSELGNETETEEPVESGNQTESEDTEESSELGNETETEEPVESGNQTESEDTEEPVESGNQTEGDDATDENTETEDESDGESSADESAEDVVSDEANVMLDGAPNGLQVFNVTVDVNAANNTTIEGAEGQLLSGSKFQIVDQSDESITMRAADLSDAVGEFNDSRALATLNLSEPVSADEVSVTVNTLTADDESEIDASAVSVELVPDLFSEPLPGSAADAPPMDLDGDGLYEDVNGDGQATFGDAITLAFVDHKQLTGDQELALDFNQDGNLSFGDAIELAFMV